MSKVPLTLRGAQMLRKELTNLKSVERPNVIQAIAQARAHGDLKENAEYHAAREQQGFIEGRIKDIEGKLSHAQIIDVTKLHTDGRVVFGSTVEVYEEETDEELTFQIVGEDEADIKQGLISISSPIARALIGKSADDVADVETPQGAAAPGNHECAVCLRRKTLNRGDAEAQSFLFYEHSYWFNVMSGQLLIRTVPCFFVTYRSYPGSLKQK